MLFQANFGFPVDGDGSEGLSHSMLSEAPITLGDWKYGYLCPFLCLGLATLCVCASQPRFSLALLFLAALL